jgi:hypothetical protein
MRILICSDGLDPTDSPIHLGGLIARPGQSQTTLLGIAEDAADEEPLRRALKTRRGGSASRAFPQYRRAFRRANPPDPAETTANEYELVIIGARRKGNGGCIGGRRNLRSD